MEEPKNKNEQAFAIHNVSDTLIAWEQFKKANWWESDAVDVEKVLMAIALNLINNKNDTG
jgi:hypothetical protein